MRKVTNIYHGTIFKNLKTILSEGIRPRGLDGFTNWVENPSHPEMVYLSTAYPFYFAQCAGTRHKKFVIFEIDFESLDPDNLYPDEDFIFQSIKEEDRIPLHEIRSLLAEPVSGYKRYYLNSLFGIGNICHRGVIDKKFIKRYCIVNFKQRPHLSISCLDPSIGILNYKFCGKKYEHMVRWFFGDEKILPQVEDIKETNFLFNNDVNTELEFWEKESKDRSGIQVKDFR